MIEASTASARSCGVIRSISAAVIIFTGFAMGVSLPCERLRVDEVHSLKERRGVAVRRFCQVSRHSAENPIAMRTASTAAVSAIVAW